MSKPSTPVEVTITAPKFQTAEFLLTGDAPLVQHKFSSKAKTQMMETQAAGSQAKSKRKKEPKDFQAVYEQTMHKDVEAGWIGVPASAFRNALIDACRMVGFKMTHAKMSVFVTADGYDDEGHGLVKITKGKPHRVDSVVRLETGVCDIHPRAMWDLGWEMVLRVKFDTDQFTITDVSNLLLRAGQQVGIGEGRPFSKNSAGMGWGTFTITTK